MLRAFIFLITVTCLSLAAIWLADRPGDVVINWLGYRIETSFAFLSAVILLTIIGGMIAYRLLLRILLAPQSISSYLQLRQDKLGIQAITHAFAALTMGDTNTAGKQIKIAERNLGQSPLLLMLAAQQSRIEGNEPQTVLYLEQMLEHKETAFLAARGLSDYSRKHGDVTKALEYAEKANAMVPDNRWVALALVDLYTRQGKWQEALLVVDKAAKKGVLTRDERKEYTSLIHFAQGKKLRDENLSSTALRFFEHAHSKNPAFIPAAIALAETQRENGKLDAAAKTVQTSWKVMPHPELATIFLKLYPGDSAAKTLKRAGKLAALNSENVESQIMLATAAIAAKEWEIARNCIRVGMDVQKNARLCRLMAQIEQEQHQDKKAAAEWTLRAASADNEPGWVCSECSATDDHWQMHCPSCNAFSTMQWKIPALRYVPEMKL